MLSHDILYNERNHGTLFEWSKYFLLIVESNVPLGFVTSWKSCSPVKVKATSFNVALDPKRKYSQLASIMQIS
jgi:hypothetical protein